MPLGRGHSLLLPYFYEQQIPFNSYISEHDSNSTYMIIQPTTICINKINKTTLFVFRFYINHTLYLIQIIVYSCSSSSNRCHFFRFILNYGIGSCCLVQLFEVFDWEIFRTQLSTVEGSSV